MAKYKVGFYILDGHEIKEVDIDEWAIWFENFDNRRVKSTVVGDVHISTVFLGIDHDWDLMGVPIVFETMIFGPCDLNEYQERYSTWDQAIAGHDKAVEAVKQCLE